MTDEPFRERPGRDGIRGLEFKFETHTPQYLLITPNDDRDDPNEWLSAGELRGVLADLDGWGIKRFMPGVPRLDIGEHAWEVWAWPEGAALLLEVRVVQPDLGEATP